MQPWPPEAVATTRDRMRAQAQQGCARSVNKRHRWQQPRASSCQPASRASAPDCVALSGSRANATGHPQHAPTRRHLLTLEVFPACPTYRHSAAAASRNQDGVGRGSRARGTQPRATGRPSQVAKSCGRQRQWLVGHAGGTGSKRAQPRDERHPDAPAKQAPRLQATVEASARRSQGARKRPGCHHGPRRL